MSEIYRVSIHDSDFDRVRGELKNIEIAMGSLKNELVMYSKTIESMSRFN